MLVDGKEREEEEMAPKASLLRVVKASDSIEEVRLQCERCVGVAEEDLLGEGS